VEQLQEPVEPGSAPARGSGRRGPLGTVAWFFLGFALLGALSALVDAALTSSTGVLEVVTRSVWAAATLVTGAAFVAALGALALARLHPRLGRETLRAAWAVGVLDVVLGLVALAGGSAPRAPGTAFFEGVGFLLAAALVTALAKPIRAE